MVLVVLNMPYDTLMDISVPEVSRYLNIGKWRDSFTSQQPRDFPIGLGEG